MTAQSHVVWWTKLRQFWQPETARGRRAATVRLPAAVQGGKPRTKQRHRLPPAREGHNFRAELKVDTAYNTTTNTGSVLSGDGAALQLDVQLSQLLTSSFSSSGSVRSLADVGVTVQSNGMLSFNQGQFDSAWAADPGALQRRLPASSSGGSFEPWPEPFLWMFLRVIRPPAQHLIDLVDHRFRPDERR